MKCSQCGFEFEGEFCSKCGFKVEGANQVDNQAPDNAQFVASQQVLQQPVKQKKKKRPFYLRWWFILLVIIVALVAVFTFTGNGEKIVWSEMILGDLLPEPPGDRGEIITNTSDMLYVDVYKLSEKDYAEYVLECKGFGFEVDIVESGTTFEAYNEDGYYLYLYYLSGTEEMSISLDCPMEFSTITWPDSLAGNQLPEPKSTVGSFSYELDDSFYLYLAETSKSDYDEYVQSCIKKGFNVDYSKGEDYFYSNNESGWYVSISYLGNNVMSISIDPPDEEVETEALIEKDIVETQAPAKEKTSDSEMDPEFKKAMDSYEDFMNDYVEFMKKYYDNPNDPTLLLDYSDYLNKYTQFCNDFAKWENEDLNQTELDYYLEVQTRVNKKLLEVTQ